MHHAAVAVRRALQRLLGDHGRLTVRSDIGELRSSLARIARSAARPLALSLIELVAGDPGRLLPSSRSRRKAHSGAHRMSPVQRLARSSVSDLTHSGRFHLPVIERRERLLPVAVCVLLLVAAAISALPAVGPSSAIGGARPTYHRITVGGLNGRYVAPDLPAASLAPEDVAGATAENDAISGPYLENGTIINNFGASSVAADGSGLLQTYVVASGDTLSGIALKFGISLRTLYNANLNQLSDLAALHIGQRLIIPPVNGVVVVVGQNDTLESLAAQYQVSTQVIVEANNLPDPMLIIGQTLIIPGAAGSPLPTPKPTPKPTPTPRKTTATTTKTGGGTTRCTTNCGGGGTYSGGVFAWPVIGGGNYISQGYWSGHRAIDIAAQYGTPVVAAAGGTVVYAGWRSYSQGGDVIWISHGGGLYSTYNHLSAWFVSAGQHVARGQRIGSIGTSGAATGPHLHFEVWRGYPWALGNNSDTVNPCIYLSRC